LNYFHCPHKSLLNNRYLYQVTKMSKYPLSTGHEVWMFPPEESDVAPPVVDAQTLAQRQAQHTEAFDNGEVKAKLMPAIDSAVQARGPSNRIEDAYLIGTGSFSGESNWNGPDHNEQVRRAAMAQKTAFEQSVDQIGN
jgi:hypothetical protein